MSQNISPTQLKHLNQFFREFVFAYVYDILVTRYISSDQITYHFSETADSCFRIEFPNLRLGLFFDCSKFELIQMDIVQINQSFTIKYNILKTDFFKITSFNDFMTNILEQISNLITQYIITN